MSVKKYVLIILLLLIFGVVGHYSKNLDVSSQSSKTPRFLQSQFSSKGVVDRVIQLKLNFETVQSNSEMAEVVAHVQMPFDFKDKLYFKWKLGEGVVLSVGELSGELNGLLKNEPKKIYLKVTGFSQEINHQIGFEIFGIRNNKKIYADALVASNLESTFENTVQNVEKIKAENKE